MKGRLRCIRYGRCGRTISRIIADSIEDIYRRWKKDLGIVQNVSLLSKKAGRVLEWRYILMNFEQATITLEHGIFYEK